MIGMGLGYLMLSVEGGVFEEVVFELKCEKLVRIWKAGKDMGEEFRVDGVAYGKVLREFVVVSRGVRVGCGRIEDEVRRLLRVDF